MVLNITSLENQKNLLQIKKYPNGQLAVFLEDQNGFPVAELSIMENSIELKENEFIFKDYSENTEISKRLANSNLIKTTNRYVIIGTHICSVCEIPCCV